MDVTTLAWVLALGNLAFGFAVLLAAGGMGRNATDPWHGQLMARAVQGLAWMVLALAGWHPGTAEVLAVQLALCLGLTMEAAAWLHLQGRAGWRAPLLAGVLACAGVLWSYLSDRAPAPALAWASPALLPLAAAACMALRWKQITPQARLLAASAAICALLVVATQLRSYGPAGAPLAPTQMAYLAYALLGGLGFFVLDRADGQRELARLATIDPLLDIANRRGFYTALEPWMALARRPGQPTSLLRLDLDHFKRVNDSYGHAAGDLVLKAAIDVVRRQLRTSDTIGRLGGEEFALVLPRTGPTEAAIVAERIRRELEAAPLKTGRAIVNLTASLGLTEIAAQDSVITLFQRADSALARAKEGGGNQVGTAAP